MGALLRAYLGLTALAGPLAAPHLRRRLARGKEDPDRWREKLGFASAPRPAGRLVWFHAVGLGEVMALRGLIAAMAGRAGVSFLVTSSARASAQVFDTAPPPRTTHQFLPLDLPGPVARFLSHWRPDLSVWAEQDLWPRLVVETARAGVPLALVNARMGARAAAARGRARGLYRDLYARFALIEAQDEATAENLRGFGARVGVGGPLKAAAPPLPCDMAELARLQRLLSGRRIWLAASTHAEDEGVALAAHRMLLAGDPGALLILAPRDPGRKIDTGGLGFARRSAGQGPDAPVWIADTYGELGLWYRLAPAALVGGGFGTGGHNPWEPAALGCAVLHGPGVENFAADHARLHAAGAVREVASAADLAQALADPGLPGMAARATAEWQAMRATVGPLAGRLLGLMR